MPLQDPGAAGYCPPQRGVYVLLLSILLRLALCSGVTWLAWRLMGPVGLVVAAPLFGLAFAKTILDGLGAAFRLARRSAVGDIEGRHFAHRGLPIDIVEDAAHLRWLKVADVRRVIVNLPADPVLRRLFPAGVQTTRPAATLRISAEALAMYLAKATDADSLKFRRWLEKEVAFPARRLRERGRPSG